MIPENINTIPWTASWNYGLLELRRQGGCLEFQKQFFGSGIEIISTPTVSLSCHLLWSLWSSIFLRPLHIFPMVNLTTILLNFLVLPVWHTLSFWEVTGYFNVTRI